MINRLILDIISRLWILYDKLRIYHPFFTHLSIGFSSPFASPAAPLAAPPWWHSPSARCAASTSAGPAPLPPATAPARPPPGPPRRSRGRCLKCWAEQKGTKNRENMWKWTRKWWMFKRNFAEFGCFLLIWSRKHWDYTIKNWDFRWFYHHQLGFKHDNLGFLQQNTSILPLVVIFALYCHDSSHPPKPRPETIVL